MTPGRPRVARAGREMLEEVAIGARFAARLPPFLRHPVGQAEARSVLRSRLEQREAALLGLARTLYAAPEGPYAILLRRAGCEYGDLERLVAQDGAEGALARLFRDGIFLTIDEFKGRRPVVRGSTTIGVEPGSSETRARRSTLRRGPAGAGAAGRRCWSTSRSFESAQSTPGSRWTRGAPPSTRRRFGWSPAGRPWPDSSSSRGSGPFRPAGSPRSTRRRRACIPGIAGAPVSCDGAAWRPGCRCRHRSTCRSTTRSRSPAGCATCCAAGSGRTCSRFRARRRASAMRRRRPGSISGARISR